MICQLQTTFNGIIIGTTSATSSTKITYIITEQYKTEKLELATTQKNQFKSGVIKPVYSEWAAPVLLATKKEGKLRFCIYYRKLNQSPWKIVTHFLVWKRVSDLLKIPRYLKPWTHTLAIGSPT